MAPQLMKALGIFILLFFTVNKIFAQDAGNNGEPAFNPTVKMRAMLQTRFETSLTDSVDAQGKITADPVSSNFRIRRAEIRADLKLNNHWSGVIRAQLPELKTVAPSTGRVLELAYFEFKGSDQLLVRGGQFKKPFELDELISNDDLRMIDRGATTTLFSANNFSSYNPGLMVYGTFRKNTMPLTYYVGVFNGSDRALNYDLNYGKDYVGRIEFTPVKGLRLGVNGQMSGVAKDVTAGAGGADISLQRSLNNKLTMIVEGEFVAANNILKYQSASDSLKDIKDYKMSGYFGLLLLRYKIGKPGLQTLEFGGRFDHTAPLSTNGDLDYNTITGGVGFIFLPDNDARLQLNLVQRNYAAQIPGVQKNYLMFVAQLQVKI